MGQARTVPPQVQLENEPLSHLMRVLIASPESRAVLNRIYRDLSWTEKASCYARWAKIFRGTDSYVESGTWSISFLEADLLLPLKSERIWLDWDSALSALGHESEIKQTYEALLRRPYLPSLFVDVGANYGTHSLLLLSQGVPVITIEPNVECHSCFIESCSLNGFHPRLLACCLGASDGEATLWYPPLETWLGTTVLPTQKKLIQRGYPLEETRVVQRTLDSLLGDINPTRILLKIDTEGSELSVFAGAEAVIDRHQPIIIFESHKNESRTPLFHFLEKWKYSVFRLPWREDRSETALCLREFLEAQECNFLARSNVGAFIWSTGDGLG